MDVTRLGAGSLLAPEHGDVARHRSDRRQSRARLAAAALTPLCLWAVARAAVGRPLSPGLPDLPDGLGPYVPAIVLVGALVLAVVAPVLGAGRSPHVLIRPRDLDVALADVKGADSAVQEVVGTLNLFLASRTFTERLGGSPRRAVLFEGPPGTGKTHLAKAMAAEAGVPFLFVSASAFQSMYYGQTNRKLRTYFAALRRHARRSGGAIGFIEEIDAIGAARSGMGGGGGREGVAGVVNELLVQLQSFDLPTRTDRVLGAVPGARRLLRRRPPANVLVVGATNRAADLDPALLRPGRFDRTITFDLPGRSARRDVLAWALARRAHDPALDEPEALDRLAAQTMGYSPAALVHLLDEALLWGLRRGSDQLGWEDLQRAKLAEEIGLAQPVEVVEAERRRIATHEAGHATVAHLVGHDRSLEVLSIVKRKRSLGLLAHADLEERFTRTASELRAMLDITLGGLVAEERMLGEHSTGVASDLAAATELAAQLVGQLGLGGSLVSFEAAVVGHGNLVAKVLADGDARAAVERLLDEARHRVEALLARHLHLVEALRDALLEREELLGDEILEVLQAAPEEGRLLDLR